MKTKAQKQKDLDALAEHFKQAHAAMLVSFKNMTVAKDQELRNQLREGAAWSAVQKTTLPESSVQTLVGIATGIPSAEAAEFLVEHLDKLPKDKDF